MMCLGVCFLGPTSLGLSELPGLPGSLFPLTDWGSSRLLCFQISLPFLALSLLLWHPYGLDVQVVLEVPKGLLIFLSSCFFILFCLNVSCFLLLQTVDLSPSFLPITVGSLYIFLYFTFIAFMFSCILWPFPTNSVSILITGVLNCASDRLAISSPLSCVFSGALICSFTWAFFFFLVWARLRCSPGRGNPQAALWRCMWGRGPRGNRAACSYPYPQANRAFLVLIPGWVGLCTF